MKTEALAQAPEVRRNPRVSFTILRRLVECGAIPLVRPGRLLGLHSESTEQQKAGV
jgi:hypothetical protein